MRTLIFRIFHSSYCNNGTCVCEPPYAGKFCERRVCTGCNGHGTCLESGSCECSKGWSGPSCSMKSACAKKCGGHGECNVDGSACACTNGWSGLDCSIPPHKTSCGCKNGGICNAGTCYCQPGFSGLKCSVLACEFAYLGIHGCLHAL